MRSRSTPRRRRWLMLASTVALVLGSMPLEALAQGVPIPFCSLEYDLAADLVPLIPSEAQNGDFFEFSWNHFLALNAPSVGGQINPSGDNTTQWAGWSSTADLLNQPDSGPSGSHFYPPVCQSAIPRIRSWARSR